MCACARARARVCVCVCVLTRAAPVLVSDHAFLALARVAAHRVHTSRRGGADGRAVRTLVHIWNSNKGYDKIWNNICLINSKILCVIGLDESLQAGRPYLVPLIDIISCINISMSIALFLLLLLK